MRIGIDVAMTNMNLNTVFGFLRTKALTLKNSSAKSLKSAAFSSPISDAVESITEVAEHLAFSRDLVRKHVTSNARKQAFENRINAIEARARDRRLHLAVIGEFSSGKSTFINALLRQRLLKAACVATTASAAYIEPGQEFSVTTTFTDDTKIKSTNTSCSNLLRRLGKIKSKLSPKATLSELLDLLTSDQAVANTVKRIDIVVPSEHLSEDIVIIDTPGINAGACGAENHAQITRQVLEEIADCAIVLVPSSSAMTDTLINFLSQNVKSFLHRCVFVLTAMDQQDQKDRPELVKMVRLKIGEKLKLPDALILESSAITAIPVKTIPTSMMSEETWIYWQNQFVEIETHLKQVMLHQRSLIITERLVRLLQELINELSGDLNNKKTKLAHEEKLLRENSVAAIEGVMNTLFAQSRTKVIGQKNAIESHLRARKSTYRTTAKSRVDEIINAAGWIANDDYEKTIVPKIKIEVENNGIDYANDLDKQLKKLRDCCESVCTVFVHQFKLNYKAFPSLPVNLSIPSISIASINVPSMSFSSSRRYIEQQNDETNKGAGVGAIVGGILGFIVAGPVGAAAGAALGGAGGAGIAGDSLEKYQNTLRSYAESDNEEFFDKYHRELNKQLDRIVDNILHQLRNIANAHVQEYGAAVGLLIDKHHAAEKRLMQEIEMIIADSQDLSRRENRLEHLRQQLLQA